MDTLSGKEIHSMVETLSSRKLHLCIHSGLQLTLAFLPLLQIKIQESQIPFLWGFEFNMPFALTTEEAGCLTFLELKLNEIKYFFFPNTTYKYTNTLKN